MIVRKFRVGGTLEDELVIMFLDDYLLQIDAAKTEFENEVSSGEVSAKAKAIGPDVFGRLYCGNYIVRHPHSSQICSDGV
jgi:hypothetical protein